MNVGKNFGVLCTSIVRANELDASEFLCETLLVSRHETEVTSKRKCVCGTHMTIHALHS